MTRTGKTIRQFVQFIARVFGHTSVELCGYCDTELDGQLVVDTDRYGLVCDEHVDRGEIEGDEAGLIDPDAAYEIYRDAHLGD
jgi:hypothetical protein